MTCNDLDSMLEMGNLCLFWISTDFTFVTLDMKMGIICIDSPKVSSYRVI